MYKQGFEAIRPSPIAGYWYSGQPEKLKKEIQSYLQLADREVIGEVMGVIAPHAGYRYSGKTAGKAYHSLLGKHYDLVVIFSPLHAYHPAKILSTKHDAYQTPLGEIAVNRELLDQVEEDLTNELDEDLIELFNDEEHSLEIQLPFLQYCLKGDFSILPFMVRAVEPWFFFKFAKILIKHFSGKQVLVVASTDLSHFYPQETAERLDKNMLKTFEKLSSEDIYLMESTNQGFACGAGAVMAAVELTKLMGANFVQIVSHTTSAEETGDFQSVVGYGAAVITKITSGV